MLGQAFIECSRYLLEPERGLYTGWTVGALQQDWCSVDGFSVEACSLVTLDPRCYLSSIFDSSAACSMAGSRKQVGFAAALANTSLCRITSDNAMPTWGSAGGSRRVEQ